MVWVQGFVHEVQSKETHLFRQITKLLPDPKQVVIPADEVIRTAGDCAFKDSVIRGVIHDHVDALLRLDVLGKSRDLANGGIHTILRPAELRPEQNAIHFVQNVV